MRVVHPKGVVTACALAVGSLSAIVACNRSPSGRDGANEPTVYDDRSGATDRASTTTLTSADLRGMSSELAVDHIVTARCQRDAACDSIGAGKHFATYDACALELHAAIGDDLRAKRCTLGVDIKVLDACIEAIRTESCNNATDTLSRLVACRTLDMCVPAKTEVRE